MRMAGMTRSPSITNGVLSWSEGDKFKLQFAVELQDQDGERLAIQDGSVFIFEFYNPRRELVKTFECTPDEYDVIHINMDTETTSLFVWDKYTCKAIYVPPANEDNPQDRITLGYLDVIVKE